MNSKKGAMTLAEGHPDFKTDADIIFKADREKRDFILRTTKDDIGLWKTKHGVNISGFKAKNIIPPKWSAKIDNEYWVFCIDATKTNDIVAAVKIGMGVY